MRQGFDEIEALMKDLIPHLERSGLSERQYKMPTGDISQINPDLQIKACEFVLSVIESPEYSDVLEARSLVREDVWNDYEMFGFTGLQEQVIYSNALKKLADLWKTDRPSYWGKHYPTQDEEYGE